MTLISSENNSSVRSHSQTYIFPYFISNYHSQFVYIMPRAKNISSLKMEHLESVETLYILETLYICIYIYIYGPPSKPF